MNKSKLSIFWLPALRRALAATLIITVTTADPGLAGVLQDHSMFLPSGARYNPIDRPVFREQALAPTLQSARPFALLQKAGSGIEEMSRFVTEFFAHDSSEAEARLIAFASFFIVLSILPSGVSLLADFIPQGSTLFNTALAYITVAGSFASALVLFERREFKKRFTTRGNHNRLDIYIVGSLAAGAVAFSGAVLGTLALLDIAPNMQIGMPLLLFFAFITGVAYRMLSRVVTSSVIKKSGQLDTRFLLTEGSNRLKSRSRGPTLRSRIPTVTLANVLVLAGLIHPVPRPGSSEAEARAAIVQQAARRASRLESSIKESPEIYAVWESKFPMVYPQRVYLSEVISFEFLDSLLQTSYYWFSIRNDRRTAQAILTRLQAFDRPFIDWVLQQFETNEVLRNEVSQHSKVIWMGVQGSAVWGEMTKVPDDIDLTVIVDNDEYWKREFSLPVSDPSILSKFAAARGQDHWNTKVQIRILSRGYVEGNGFQQEVIDDLRQSGGDVLSNNLRMKLRHRSQTLGSLWATAIPLFFTTRKNPFSDMRISIFEIFSQAKSLVTDVDAYMKKYNRDPNSESEPAQFALNKAHKRLLELEAMIFWLISALELSENEKRELEQQAMNVPFQEHLQGRYDPIMTRKLQVERKLNYLSKLRRVREERQRIVNEINLALPSAAALELKPIDEGPQDKGLPNYLGSGDTSIHKAIDQAAELIRQGKMGDATSQLEELIRDLQAAANSQNIEPLMDKWNARYPTDAEVDLLLTDVPAMIAAAKALLVDAAGPMEPQLDKIKRAIGDGIDLHEWWLNTRGVAWTDGPPASEGEDFMPGEMMWRAQYEYEGRATKQIRIALNYINAGLVGYQAEFQIGDHNFIGGTFEHSRYQPGQSVLVLMLNPEHLEYLRTAANLYGKHPASSLPIKLIGIGAPQPDGSANITQANLGPVAMALAAVVALFVPNSPLVHDPAAWLGVSAFALSAGVYAVSGVARRRHILPSATDLAKFLAAA